MGLHAGHRNIRARGVRIGSNGAIWETFLGHLATMSAIEASKLPEMPSAPAFNKRRRRDPAFDAKASAIMAARRLNTSGRKRIEPSAWSAFLGAASSMTIAGACALPGMPSQGAIYVRRRRDPWFRERLAQRILRPAGETLNTALMQNDLYAAVAAAVPTFLQKSHREDVIAEMVLAILEGRATIRDTKTFVRKFYHDNFEDNGRAVSFDVRDERSYDEIASSISARDWRDAEMNDRRSAYDAISQTFYQPTQIEDVWHTQMRRRHAELSHLGFSFADAVELYGAAA